MSNKTKRFCSGCLEPLPESASLKAIYCSSSCRNQAKRLKRKLKLSTSSASCHPEKPIYVKGMCKSCYVKLKGYQKTKEAKNKRREHHLKTAYGMASYSFNALLLLQDFRCAICSKLLGIDNSNYNTTACVDHNHKTGEVRGILCKPCNSILGFSRDNLGILQYASDYLNNTKEKCYE